MNEQPDYRELLEKQREYFFENLKNSTATARIKKLKAMKKWIFNHKAEIRNAVYEDFRKPAHETDVTEILPPVMELKDAIRNLRDWMRPKRIGTPLTHIGTWSKVVYEPKGQSLILAPWNYPFMLTVAPMVSAVAAGCTVVLKPSEFSMHTSVLIEGMVKELFDPAEVTCVMGDHTVAQALTALPFDHIFFTGSTEVGKKVMRAASDHLASVTLELGGQNPTIIDETANLADTAKKLVWGKYLNAGQSCMSPNYVLIHEKIYDRFLEAFRKAFEKAYPEHHGDMRQSPDFARVINYNHLTRLGDMIDESVAAGAKLLRGGDRLAEEDYLSPTVLGEVSPDHAIMREEVFGPVLPFIRYKQLDEAIEVIRSIEKPLALYIFSRSNKNIKRILQATSSGNVMINETTIAFGHPGFPLGGVNHSGMGKAHGHSGFLLFSNEKAVMRQNTLLGSSLLARPPYSKWKSKALQIVIRWF